MGISRDRNYLQYLVLSAPSYMSMEYSQGDFLPNTHWGAHPRKPFVSFGH